MKIIGADRLDQAKLEYAQSLGLQRVLAIGTGSNDLLLLRPHRLPPPAKLIGVTAARRRAGEEIGKGPSKDLTIFPLPVHPRACGEHCLARRQKRGQA